LTVGGNNPKERAQVSLKLDFCLLHKLEGKGVGGNVPFSEKRKANCHQLLAVGGKKIVGGVLEKNKHRHKVMPGGPKAKSKEATFLYLEGGKNTKWECSMIENCFDTLPHNWRN